MGRGSTVWCNGIRELSTIHKETEQENVLPCMTAMIAARIDCAVVLMGKGHHGRATTVLNGLLTTAVSSGNTRS
jgi:hypothetical protein